MIEIVDIFVPLEALDDSLKTLAAHALGWADSRIGEVRVLRRSLDARKERRLGYRMRVEVASEGESLAIAPARAARPSWPVGVPVPRVVIVGSGPAGAWAALRLAEAGVATVGAWLGKPTVMLALAVATLKAVVPPTFTLLSEMPMLSRYRS